MYLSIKNLNKNAIFNVPGISNLISKNLSINPSSTLGNTQPIFWLRTRVWCPPNTEIDHASSFPHPRCVWRCANTFWCCPSKYRPQNVHNRNQSVSGHDSSFLRNRLQTRKKRNMQYFLYCDQ